MDGNTHAGGRSEFVAGIRLGLQLLTDRIATEAEVFDPSLESIVAAETSISSFDERPRLRGYDLAELMGQASFPEVAFLLLEGDLPDSERLSDFQSVLSESTEVPKPIIELVTTLPLHVSMMEVIRTSVSTLAHFDPQPYDRDHVAIVNQSLRLVAKLPRILAARQVVLGNGSFNDTDPDLNFASYLLELLTGSEPTPEAESAFEAALTVVCEQGLDASTLAARAAISTGGDLFSSVTAALAVWSGPLHGGPRTEIVQWLLNAAEVGPEEYLQKEISHGRGFPGFDARVAMVGDIRATWLTPYCRHLSKQVGKSQLEETAERLELRIGEETGAGPTLDWPLSRLLMYLGIDRDLFKPIAAIARLVGWAAHAAEQAERNQLFRPRGRYIGPTSRPFRPLDERE